MVIEALGECIAHLVIEREIIRIRADDDQAAIRFPVCTQVADEFIFFKEDAGELYARGNIVIAGTAGHKQNHDIGLSKSDYESL